MANKTLLPDVEITIQQSTPVITQGLGTPAIFVKVKDAGNDFKPTVKSYANASDIAVDGASTDTNTFQLAQLIFAQNNRPEHIDVIRYSDISKDMAAVQEEDWVFGILSDVSDSDEVASFAMIASELSKKFIAIQVADPAQLESLGSLDRVIGFVHPLDKGRLDAAVIGNVANLTPGSVTWKFRQVTGIAENGFGASQLLAVEKVHGIAMKPVNGTYVTSEGWTLSGKYIDELHSLLWIQNEILAALQDVELNNGKVIYDDRGITLIKSAISTVFNRAYNMGIVATDDSTGRAAFNVTASSRSDQTASDVANRIYRGASFEFVQANAIHKLYVSGQVVSSL